MRSDCESVPLISGFPINDVFFLKAGEAVLVAVFLLDCSVHTPCKRRGSPPAGVRAVLLQGAAVPAGAL